MALKRPRRKPQDARNRSGSTRRTQAPSRGRADCDVQLSALMTVAEVAKALRRHPEVIRDWIRDGRLVGHKVGRDWVVTESELARFKKDQPERRKRQ